MALDASIPLQYRGIQLEDPANALMRVGQLQAMRQRNALAQMQMQQAQEEMALARQKAMQDAQARAQQQAAREAAFPMPESLAVSRNGGPTMQASNALAAMDPRIRATMTLARAGLVKPEDALSVLDPNFGRAEVARTIERMGATGPEPVQFDKFGNPVGQALPKAVEMRLENLGGSSVAVNPYLLKPGQTFQRTVTPDAVLSAATARRGQDMTDSRQREANDLQRQAQRTQVFDTPNGPMLIDKGTGAGRPVTTAEGRPVPGESAMKRESGSRRVLTLLKDAEELVPQATGSYAGAAVDMAARTVGQAPKGAQAIAKLKAIEGSLLAEMPRMEGPQSNFDVQMYKQAAGELGDPTSPRQVKLAAIQQIREIQQRYSGQQPAQPAPTSQDGWSIKPKGQ